MKRSLLLLLLFLPFLTSGQVKPLQKKTTAHGSHGTGNKQTAKPSDLKKQLVKSSKEIKSIPGEMKFFDGSIEELEDSSRKSGRPYFILFYTPRDPNSRELIEKVLNDTSITRLVDTAMIAYRMDTYTNAYKIGIYNLEDIPALLLYDHNIQEIGRLEGEHKLPEVKKFFLSAFK